MSATQFNVHPTKNKCEIVLGFDFGTSSSKVIVRSPDHFSKKAVAVRFGEVGHPSCPYLLPSLVWVGNDGVVSLKRQPAGRKVREIKKHLIKNEKVPAIGPQGARLDPNPEEVAVAYLALALRKTRDWFIAEQRKLYGKFELLWDLNLGLPSADYADKSLCETYNRVARAAWVLSLRQGPLTLRQAAEILSNPEKEMEKLAERDWAEIQAIPEVAAAVAGYARSEHRKEGLHVLVDIGASTIDLCGFILHNRDDDDCYELLSADVQLLGALILYDKRVEALNDALENHMNRLTDQYDPVTQLKDNIEDFMPSRDSLDTSIKAIEANFSKDCKSAIFRTLNYLKEKRDPNSGRWASSLPFFLTGGGAELQIYRSVIDEASKWMKEHWTPGEQGQGKRIHSARNQGIEVQSIVKPKDLDLGEHEHINNRLVVAWGLSYRKTDIGQISRPSEIDDIQRQEPSDYGD